MRSGLCKPYGALDLGGEAARLPGLGERAVLEPPAVRTQHLSEMPHRREDERDLLAVMRDVRRLLVDLAHEHEVALTIGVAQRGERKRELIAEHQDEPPSHRVASPPPRRQRSEQ
jgi:hypothetical protein